MFSKEGAILFNVTKATIIKMNSRLGKKYLRTPSD